MSWPISSSVVFGLLFFVAPFLYFVLKKFVSAAVEQSVRANFEKDLELVRAELRSSEERLKSDLRRSEAELESIRSGLLSVRSSRAALVDAKRINAIEQVWILVGKLNKLKFGAIYVSMLNLKELYKETPNSPKLQEFVSMLAGNKFEEFAAEIQPGVERLYVSEIVWALYSAYLTIIFNAHAQLKILAIGAKDADKLFNPEEFGKIIKAALPHQAQFIDKYGISGASHLLGELETRLLAELRRDLEDEGVAREAAAAANIMTVLREVAEKHSKLPAGLATVERGTA